MPDRRDTNPEADLAAALGVKYDPEPTTAEQLRAAERQRCIDVLRVIMEQHEARAEAEGEREDRDDPAYEPGFWSGAACGVEDCIEAIERLGR